MNFYFLSKKRNFFRDIAENVEYLERVPVMGIPMVIILGFTFLPMLFPPSFELLPYALTTPRGGIPSIAFALAMGQPIPSPLPIIANTAWIILFIGVAIWRFQREKF
jgi:hypothetical protein